MKNTWTKFEAASFHRKTEPRVADLCDHLEWCLGRPFNKSELVTLILPMDKVLRLGFKKRNKMLKRLERMEKGGKK